MTTAMPTQAICMHMSKLTFDPMRSVDVVGNPDIMHRKLRPCLPPREGNPGTSRGAVVDGNERRDLMWRLETVDNKIEVVAQTTHAPNWAPLLEEGLLVGVEQRLWRPRVRAGTPITFRLHASPHRKRHKFVSEEKRLCWRVPLTDVESQEAWLAKRLTRAGEILSLSAMGWRDYEAVKGLGDHGRGRRPQVVKNILVSYEGILTVRNEDEFMKLLMNGIGPGKHLGLGLLVIGLPPRA